MGALPASHRANLLRVGTLRPVLGLAKVGERVPGWACAGLGPQGDTQEPRQFCGSETGSQHVAQAGLKVALASVGAFATTAPAAVYLGLV